MDREIEIYKSKRQAITIIIISLAILVTGILLLTATDKTVAGWSIIILAALGLLFSISSVSDKKPQIKVNETGISDRTFPNELIEWGAIRNATSIDFRGQRYIRLVVDKDYKPSLPGNRFYRLDYLNNKAGIKAVYIKMSMIDADPAKLILFTRAMAQSNPAKRHQLMQEVPGFQR